MPIIEPRMLGLLPDDKTKSSFRVIDKSNVERKIFDTDGEVYNTDGTTLSAHVGSAGNPHNVVASQVGVTDSGSYFTGANVETAMQEIGSQLADITLNIVNYKTESNTWNDAFDLAYTDLPTYGGTILIPKTITIQRSINLHTLGTKKVLIEGNYSNLNNPSNNYNSIIVKQGDFDAVVLNHGSAMRNIGVSRDSLFTDTHDGIYVAGITCTLENVGVNDQGRDGFRIGSKNDVDYSTHYNCNIGRFTNIRAVNNGGWGVKVRDDFSTGINTSDANACVFFSPDVRDNDAGGILFEKCIDNIVYSPDCEVNHGEAGIKIGDETTGIHVYSPYTENPDCTDDILLTSGSSKCIVWGYRGGSLNDRIKDLGTGNLVLGTYGAKWFGFHMPNRFNVDSLLIGKRTATGYFTAEQNASNGLDIMSRGGSAKVVNFKSDGGDFDVAITAKSLRTTRDVLNSIRVRPSSSTSEFNILANSSTTRSVNSVVGILAGDIIIANPSAALPSGISYYCFASGDGVVNIVFVNSTSTTVTIPLTTWRVYGLNGTALT